ncbi:ribosomal large subunit pseudouridine synthase B [Sulfurihydrogenibium azorense Az-Fu1]|jgi:23S rRNA pseudouridine2605 synthase|uniref:Pseudouridine synthase n=1 Tax=Sulfurihydrogenibium azorense (strain DSM 15241 / OCM 825 / Az-Fu1) TaxID=204536 RepID=C1DTU8_SULAA|nr:pseudouridine synthase [Sulfurihydrogenibium azorense]ACN98977.1 ribosomal large subunit pseudouridine synthase B [Sulfurihydrogenibium azorense Az-Fu1]
MERLNKYIAKSGICSRRKADELILEGKVKVNGKTVKNLGLKIDPKKDVVEVEGKIVKPTEKKIYLAIYKPVGYLSAVGKDRFGRKTLTDFLNELKIPYKLFPVGRLDYNSEGLLILTNDGEFANKVAHPRNEIKKVYKVKVAGEVSQETLKKMEEGTILEDGFFKPDKIKMLKREEDGTWLLVEIHSGKKRIIRRFMDSFGHRVKRLIRVKIGSIDIGNLKPFDYRYLSEKEIRSILDEKRDSFKQR